MNIKLEIPESFYQGEERCGYYVSPEMKKVWAVQLDLLNEFSRVCEKHNIKWWMDAGTLLGAVRHKGFIPWDDDIDVILMRSEYERFCEVAPQELQHPYCLRTATNNGRTRGFAFAKLHNEDTTIISGSDEFLRKNNIIIDYDRSLWLDIFPIDNLPDDNWEYRKLLWKSGIINQMAGKIIHWTDYYYPAAALWKRPIKALLHYLLGKMNVSYERSYKPLWRKFMDVIVSCKQDDSKRVAKLAFRGDPKFMTRRIWSRSDFDGTVYLPFEMLTLPAPSGWENILNHFYGNWHEYFIRDRHGVFYDTEHSYKYYTQEGHPINEDLV